MKITYLLVAALLLAGNPVSAQNSKIEIHGSLSEIVGRYRNLKFSAPDEISLACLGEVFSQWYRGYESVLKANSKIRKSNIAPWMEAERLSSLHEKDSRKFFPLLRPDLMPAIRHTLEEYREANAIPRLPWGMTTSQIFADEYNTNLLACLNPDFRATVGNLAPLAGE